MLLKQQVRWKQISVDFNFKKNKSRESNFDPSVPGRENVLICSLQVIQPYITGLEIELKRRFQELDILGAFHVLRPQSAALPDNMCIAFIILVSCLVVPSSILLLFILFFLKKLNIGSGRS